MNWNLGNTATFAIDPDSVNQIVCIHTNQGLEFEYVGVIIGNDLKFRHGKIITDYTSRAKTDQLLKGIKKLEKENAEIAYKRANEIIKNTYRTLLSRGCLIYCCDKELEEY